MQRQRRGNRVSGGGIEWRLTSKLLAVDGLATSAVVAGEVASLEHELRHPMRLFHIAGFGKSEREQGSTENVGSV
jgi:hypothetical protein